MKTKLVTAIAAVWIANVGLLFGATEDNVTERVRQYVDALVKSDFSAAAGFWHPQFIETSERLGIKYRGVDNKYDCVSPLVENLPALRSGVATWNVSVSMIDPEHYKAIVQISSPDTSISSEYFIQVDSTGSYLIPRFWLYLNNISVVKTKYFDIFYHDPEQLNEFAVYDIDRFVESVASALGTAPEKLAKLERARMEYFLALSEHEVAELLGFPSRGSFLMTSDIIITEYLPDYHEIARFMLAYSNPDPGLYVEPFVDRGLACTLGGRFGQASAVMPQIANFTLKNDLYSMEDVLTFGSFLHKIGNIDFSFPLSYCLMHAIIDTSNMAAAMRTYADLSGNVSQVDSLTADDVKAVIEKNTGKSWAKIDSLACRFASVDPFPNLKPGTTGDSGQLVFQSGTADYILHIKHADGWYNFFIDRVAADRPVDGLITIQGSIGTRFRAYKSFLFGEQFPDDVYGSHIYGIKFNDTEVGVYDYFSNSLIAKYVSGFDTSNRLVSGKLISFRIKDDVFRDRLDGYVILLCASGTPE